MTWLLSMPAVILPRWSTPSPNTYLNLWSNMSNDQITFGWVIYPVPRGQTAEEASSPQSAGRALFQANERYIEAMQPHFNTVWVEDHFQWDNRPVLEAMTTLTYLAGRHEKL